MTLKTFIDSLNNLVQDHPEALEMKVVYSIDEEGNSFHTVQNDPTLGRYKKRDFDPESENPNSVCIN